MAVERDQSTFHAQRCRMMNPSDDVPTARTIHQICIVEGYGLPAFLPESIGQNITSFRSIQTGYAHKLWTGEEIRDFLRREFDQKLLRSFDRLRPYSYKCDLARLCILYRFGGLYADLGMRLIHRYEPPTGMGFAAFRSLSFLTPSWTTMSNGIFFAEPGRRELLIALESVVRNCLAGHYGAGPLHPTGPVLFGRAIAMAMLERTALDGVDDQWIGEVRFAPDGSGTTHHVAPGGTLISINTKAGRSLGQMGLEGSNSYGEAWAKREIYEVTAGP